MIESLPDLLQASPVAHRLAIAAVKCYYTLTGRRLLVRLDGDYERATFGNPGASFTVATAGLSSQTVVVSVGVGEDLSFDLGLMAAYGLRVEAFDPTPKSLAWATEQSLPEALCIHPIGLADFDGEAVFHPPQNPAHVSHSAVIKHCANTNGIRCQVRRLKTLMEMIEVDHIDILKIDIEGSEYAVIEDIAGSAIRPRQILVEYHHRFPGIGKRKTRASTALLRSLGYRLFDVSVTGGEYSFIYANT